MRLFLILICILSSTCFARIRVGYIVTQGAANNMSNVYNWVVSAHAALNQSYINSGYAVNDPNVSAILAYIRVDSYVAAGVSGGYATHLSRLAGTNDGYFDYIQNDKITYNLDVVVLVTEDGSLCGRAYDIAPAPSNAYVVTYWACDNAPSYSNMGHEIGHVIGARHATNEDNANTVINGQTYTFVHGYCNQTNNFATVMVGNYPSCASNAIRQNFYSDTYRTFNGVLRGDATANVRGFFDNQFSRIGNASGISATANYANQTIQTNQFNDVVATNTITSSNVTVSSGGGLYLRSNGSITLSSSFAANSGSSVRIVAGGTDPLSKKSIGMQESGKEPGIIFGDLIKKDILYANANKRGITISYNLISEPVNAVRIQLIDLHGKLCFSKEYFGSANTLFIPKDFHGMQTFIIRLTKNNKYTMVRPVIFGK